MEVEEGAEALAVVDQVGEQDGRLARLEVEREERRPHREDHLVSVEWVERVLPPHEHNRVIDEAVASAACRARRGLVDVD